MDENQIAMLEANGYDYIQGAIVDPAGTYISALDLNGQHLVSESTEDFYNESMATFKAAEDAQKNPETEIEAFKNDPILKNISTYDKEQKIVAKDTKKHLKLAVQKEYFTESQVKEIYNYPIVLGLSLLIFYLIKKLKV